MMQIASIPARLGEVRAAIAGAAKAAGRDPASVTLIAVGKTFGAVDMRSAISAGQHVFGENRVQEAQGKWPELKAERADLDLHLIGPLQSNKAKEALVLFNVIHTLDRESLAAELAKLAAKTPRMPRLFVQVNTGAEAQKAGVLPEEADAFITRCRDVHGLIVEGLMCIPPAEENPAPHFALLEKIAGRNGLKELSMGMSGDFETAIAFGATYVRVGSAIFGER
jgi:pyridoxal phosphate enzyme (YggS family)